MQLDFILLKRRKKGLNIEQIHFLIFLESTYPNLKDQVTQQNKKIRFWMWPLFPLELEGSIGPVLALWNMPGWLQLKELNNCA